MGGEGKKVARPDHLDAAALRTSESQLRSHSQSSHQFWISLQLLTMQKLKINASHVCLSV